MSLRHAVVRACLATGVAVGPSTVHAAFFALAENSPAGLGNAFAGGGAIAEDASTVWYNPAGMTRLPGSQMVVGLYAVRPSAKFEKTSATTVLGATTTGSNGGDYGESAFIPNFYYSRALSDRTWFGIGVNAPFGMATQYDDGWVGRYHALRSEIKTVNINPSVAYKVSDKVSVGAGISIQVIDATLTQNADLGTICAVQTPGSCAGLGLLPQQDDAHADLSGDGASHGVNVGLLWQLSDAARVGFAYRSKVKQSLTGTRTVTFTDAGQSAYAAAIGQGNTGIRTDITMPATWSVSGLVQLNPQWLLLGDITRTDWHYLPELRIRNDNGSADTVITLRLKDSYRYSAGLTYLYSSTISLRAGIALDQTPTPSPEYRTPRVPDADRTWLTFGIGIKHSKSLSFDAGYAYIRNDKVDINKRTTDTENTYRGNLSGTYDATTHILSAQLNWMF
ncbi:MAG: hypothetical protein A2140_00480 [Candidatus Muproteobacteria bacterium RBG_16_62_13]|uniref:Long-chain fatty acid transporter n=1 Tax=Candidatus Muproteobacteria bacterium RBG_16_62_13 TaxID=1817756 RepID=A0A1F6T722_9PROT|nr:MAG: hypothetical protein A2140_00480 [Candidatus Muproteobacteria bacterium RBG_16_62_13]